MCVSLEIQFLFRALIKLIIVTFCNKPHVRISLHTHCWEFTQVIKIHFAVKLLKIIIVIPILFNYNKVVFNSCA